MHESDNSWHSDIDANNELAQRAIEAVKDYRHLLREMNKQVGTPSRFRRQELTKIIDDIDQVRITVNNELKG